MLRWTQAGWKTCCPLHFDRAALTRSLLLIRAEVAALHIWGLNIIGSTFRWGRFFGVPTRYTVVYLPVSVPIRKLTKFKCYTVEFNFIVLPL